jgi:hypothetical protein
MTWNVETRVTNLVVWYKLQRSSELHHSGFYVAIKITLVDLQCLFVNFYANKLVQNVYKMVGVYSRVGSS